VLRKKWKLAGIVLAGMIALKLFPVVLLIYYGLKKQWLVVTSSLISVCVLLVISVLLFGHTPHLQYVDKAVTRFTEGIHTNGLSRHNNVTLNGFIHRFFLLNKHTNPFDQNNWEVSLVALQKLSERIAKTEVDITAKQLNLGKWIHSAIVAPLFLGMLYLCWRTGKSGLLLIEVSLWMSLIFFIAKDAHIQYLVLLLPMWLMLALQPPNFIKNKPAIIVLLSLSFVFMSLSETIFLVSIPVPNWLYVLPLGLLGNGMFLFVLSVAYFKQLEKLQSK
jgi:hypothetical protein